MIMTELQEEIEIGEYTVEEAIAILESAVARKQSEIQDYSKRLKRYKNAAKKQNTEALCAFLGQGVAAYRTLLNDITGEESYLEGIEFDQELADSYEDPQEYLDALSADDLENEMEAETIRSEYCEMKLAEISVEIGTNALRSKKMIKVLRDDPYALEVIGDMILNDDYLFDLFVTIQENEENKSKKKKKKRD